MLVTYILLGALSCPNPNIINKTKYPWNAWDQKILNRAKVRCGELYTDAPCVITFIKRGEQDYSVICGKKR